MSEPGERYATDSVLTYRPDIDGLRALAVLPVVFYHAGFTTFAGGYVGVDIFFVISGYLITSLIFDEIRDGTFRFRNFYLRRIRRLFPALFTVVLVSCIPAYWLLLPEELEDFGQSVASLAVFASNVLFWSEAGYFASSAEMKPLLHTWSLAIEEQYYLLFPVLLLGIKRLRHAPYVAVVLVLLASSLLVSALTVYTAPEAAFYLLPSRTWELLLGSVIAMTGMAVGWAWLRESLAVLGLVLIAVAVFTFSSEMPFPGLAAVVPCLGTAFLIVSARNETTRVARALSDRRLVFFGLISYSLYLWHWPILVYAKHYFLGLPDLGTTWLLLVIAVLAAYLSWRFVEQPFRGKRGILTSGGVFRFAGSTIVLLIAVGMAFDLSDGLPGRLDDRVRAVLAVAEDRPARRKRCEGVPPEAMTLERLCRVRTDDPTPSSFLVWGDSHANMLIPAIASAAENKGLNGHFAVANGCVPLLGVRRVLQTTDVDCAAFNDAVLSLLEQHPELATVVIAARWGLHAEGTGYGEGARAFYLRDLGGDTRAADSPEENRMLFKRAFARTVDRLEALGREVVLMGPVPEVTDDVPAALAKAAWRNRTLPLAVDTAEFLVRQQAFLTSVDGLEDNPGRSLVRWLPLHGALCDPQRCVISADGLPLYFDDNHLASTGLRRIEPALADLFTPTSK